MGALYQGVLLFNIEIRFFFSGTTAGAIPFYEIITML
jgi:hypothetical protein